MPVQLNHTIVHARDKQEAAAFFSDILGLPAPVPSGPFLAVQCANDITLDFADHLPSVTPQHYAFLVSGGEFDAILGRIQARGAPYWADPHAPTSPRAQHARGGTGPLLGGPERPQPRDPHPQLMVPAIVASGLRRRGRCSRLRLRLAPEVPR